MLPALIAAGTSILGGILGNKASEKANKAAEANAQKQYEQQKEFAQSGIQWKVADAEKAGVHPLYALGANTVSYAPQSVGSTPSNFDFVGQAGQNIGRAIDATRSNPRKMEAMALTASQIQLEGLQLDNELKRTQLQSAITLANQTGKGPGLPGLFTRNAVNGIDGQGDTPQIDGVPAQHKATPPQYTTNLRAFGKDYQPNPSFSDAQSYEDRYGEISDYIAGPINAMADYYHNIYKPNLAKQIDKARREGRIRNYR